MMYGPMNPPMLPTELIKATPVAAPASFKKVAGQDAITCGMSITNIRRMYVASVRADSAKMYAQTQPQTANLKQ